VRQQLRPGKTMPECSFQFGQNCFHLRPYHRNLLDSFLETAPQPENPADRPLDMTIKRYCGT
jgi:hypothetical protein